VANPKALPAHAIRAALLLSMATASARYTGKRAVPVMGSVKVTAEGKRKKQESGNENLPSSRT
jgi:hypothetical protein